MTVFLSAFSHFCGLIYSLELGEGLGGNRKHAEDVGGTQFLSREGHLLAQGDLYLLFYCLFDHGFIWLCTLGVYFMLRIRTLHYLFYCSNCSSLGYWEPFGCLLCLGRAWSLLTLSWHDRELQVLWDVLCPPWQKDALLLLWLCYVVAVSLELPVGRPCSCTDHKEQEGLTSSIEERQRRERTEPYYLNPCWEPAYCILSAYCILHIECSTFHSIIFQDLE